ncbi:golgin subfamily A member 6-like protein 6 [Vespa crabro]|uniref:golgin subfamily A member 6-like protein 6 n=1 Tax=Vespa crabro TaxID=7445 RepID=UPI001F01E089|nr:golgin subfamily A member 6-like protein 6 [Vespa crabro]
MRSERRGSYGYDERSTNENSIHRAKTISDEAELWHKWLCSHINLFIRMASRLKEIEEEYISELKKLQPEMIEEIRRIFAYEEDAIADDGIEYPEGVEDFYDIEQVLADIVSGKEKSVEKKDEGEERALEEIVEEDEEKEEMVNEKIVNETEEEEEKEEAEEAEEKEEEDEEGKERMGGGADQPEETTNEEDSTAVISEMEEERVEEIEEKEEEKEEKKENDEIVEKKDKDEIVDDDTSEYLKEWPLGIQWEPFGIQKEKDRTDIIEAIKEIVGRTIMSTAKLRGILKDENPEASLKRCLNNSKGRAKRNSCFSPPIKPAQMMALSKRIGTEEFLKEMARAEEDIPYFFYRKIDPDIEIAIKHDDEEVIPLDPDNEVIFVRFSSFAVPMQRTSRTKQRREIELRPLLSEMHIQTFLLSLELAHGEQ